MTKADRLRRMLNPARVVWIGGGGMAPAIDYMRQSGFSGKAAVVHPSRRDIAGLPCVPSVADLPFVPDLAVLVIPKDTVVETVAALSDIGCGGVVCITSGFSESVEGAARETELIAAAGEMPLIGPNCPGIANFLDHCAFMMDHFGHHAPDRGVAVISNGGAYLSDLGCADRSQPIAYLLGLGNQATVSIADAMDAVLDDPRVTAINVYFEGLGDAAALSHAAAKAARKKIPVVAIKGGRSDVGARAAQSHTASLAGDAAIASALFRRFGWIEVSTPSEAIETLKMLSHTALPTGLKTGFVTSSGSYAVLGGDMAEAVGLEMHPPSDLTAACIDAALPPYVGPANPLDISDAHGWSKKDQLPIYQAFAQDEYDLFVQVMCYPPAGGWDQSTWDATTQALAEAKGNRPAAFVNTLADALPRDARERMIANGMAPLQGLEDGLRAVAHAARYGQARAGLNPDAIILGAPAETGPPDTRHQLDEAQAKSRLRAAGLDVPDHWIVCTGDDAPRMVCRMALKALVPELLHKSEAGAVALNLEPAELPDAIDAMSARLAKRGLIAKSFLIEEMIQNPVAELLVGLRRFDGVGTTLTLAIGGVAVELLQDSATLILPTTRADIEKAIRGLKLSPLLTGYRGRRTADMDTTLDAIDALCDYLITHPDIQELEINPLILTEARAVVADAVMILKG